MLVLLETVLEGGDAPPSASLVINAQIPHDRLDGWVVWPKNFVQGSVSCLVGDDEGSFVVVDLESGRGQCLSQFLPCFHNAVGQHVRVVVLAIKSDVIDPAVEVQIRMLGLEGAKDGLKKGLGKQWSLGATGSDAMGDVKPMAQFSIGEHCLGAGIDLHSKFKSQWWILQCLCHCLQLLKVDGVIESAHVQQHCDAVLA